MSSRGGGSSTSGGDVKRASREDVLALLKQPGNDFCADCGAMAPDWASVNTGVLMCIRCSGIHRQLGVQASFVQSVYLDQWKLPFLETLRDWGNLRANAIWEAKLPRQAKPSQSTATAALQQFITDKYVHGKWLPDGELPRLFEKLFPDRRTSSSKDSSSGDRHRHHHHRHKSSSEGRDDERDAPADAAVSGAGSATPKSSKSGSSRHRKEKELVSSASQPLSVIAAMAGAAGAGGAVPSAGPSAPSSSASASAPGSNAQIGNLLDADSAPVAPPSSSSKSKSRSSKSRSSKDDATSAAVAPATSAAAKREPMSLLDAFEAVQLSAPASAPAVVPASAPPAPIAVYRGILFVHLKRGENLPVGDIMSSDPFCVFSVGAQTQRSKTVPNTLNPTWNETLKFNVSGFPLKLHCTVMDEDDTSDDDLLGSFEMVLTEADLQAMSGAERTMKLDHARCGVVRFTLQYESLMA